jgi:hypothetical protein
MNERIEKLAEQAMAKAVAKNFTGEKLELRMPSEAWAKEFAELIVRECAGVTLDYKNDDYYRGWCDHAEEILRHFGVEK